MQTRSRINISRQLISPPKDTGRARIREMHMLRLTTLLKLPKLLNSISLSQ